MGLLDDLWVDAPMPAQGIMRPPQRSGHSLAFKPDVLKEFAVNK
jgi:hypothetical protein